MRPEESPRTALFIDNSPADTALYGLLLFATGVLLSMGYSAYMVYAMPIVSKEKFPVANAIVNMAGQLGGAQRR